MELSLLTKYVIYQLYHTILVIPKITSSSDPLYLHQFRVSLRRTRALLKLYPHSNLPFPPKIKEFVKQTNPLRELDVLLLTVSPKKYPQAHQHLKNIRDSRHDELFTQAQKEELIRELTLFYDLFVTANPLIGKERLIHTSSLFYDETVEMYRMLEPNSDEKKLHALRIRFKISRYGLEFLADTALYNEYEKIQQCKELQDKLGEIQDMANQIDWFKAMYSDSGLPEFKKLLQERKHRLKKLRESSR